MTTIAEYNPSIDFEKHIFWQYNNSPAITSLEASKQNWYDINQTKFWNDWVTDVLNIKTANDYGLSIWGILLCVPRNYLINNVIQTLSRNQYRNVILARLRMLKMRGTVPEINSLLKFLFGQYGKAYVVDNYNMSLTYHFNFNLSDLQLAVLNTVNLLPRPAGVKINIVSMNGNVFGFNSVYDTVTSYEDLEDYDTSGLPENTIINVFEDTDNDDKADYSTYYIWQNGEWKQISNYTQLGQPFDQAPFATYIHNV